MQTGLARFRTMRRLTIRTMRRLSAGRPPAALPLRGCWQLGMSVMQHLGSTLRQLSAVMTGASLQYTVGTALLLTLVAAKGRRQQVKLQMR